MNYVTNYLTCTIAKREALKQSIKAQSNVFRRKHKNARERILLDCFATARNDGFCHSEAESRRISY